MKENPISLTFSSKWGIVGIFLSAFGASICCIGPLVLLTLGIGGAWAGNLAVFDNYRPIFMGINFVSLGLAFYQVYRKPKTDACCDTGGQVVTMQRKKLMKTTLWIVAVLALGVMAFPYFSPNLANAAQNAALQSAFTHRVVLTIHNMTCSGCAMTVQQSLAKVDGVIIAEVSLEPPEAVVVYDPGKVSVDDLTAAPANTGYPSEVKEK